MFDAIDTALTDLSGHDWQALALGAAGVLGARLLWVAPRLARWTFRRQPPGREAAALLELLDAPGWERGPSDPNDRISHPKSKVRIDYTTTVRRDILVDNVLVNPLFTRRERALIFARARRLGLTLKKAADAAEAADRKKDAEAAFARVAAARVAAAKVSS